MRRFGRIVLASASVAAACLAAEAATRLVDGYALWSTRLVRVRAGASTPSDTGKLMDPRAAGEYAARLPVADSVQRNWFSLNPAPVPVPPVDPELERRYWSSPGNELPSVYEWNREFVRRVMCGGTTEYPYLAAQFRRLTDAFVFEPADRQPYPTYRFLRSVRYPSGLVTNAYGWRGPDLPMSKPAGRIRVAFVGASTTLDAHGDPFSYPEYVGRWLQEWARERHPELSFDVINAGREGVLSNSIAAIVRQEVAPFAPDIVVYYEGANQFWPNDFVSRPVERALRLMRAGVFAERSAIGARIRNLMDRPESGDEPRKPSLSVSWPADLDVQDPPLDDPRLPVQLPIILHDLDAIRHAAAETGGALMVSSFAWLVAPGLVLDPSRDALIFRELNERYWPFSYAHMRRYIDFENRVFEKYARTHGLPFNDVARSFPPDPRLFVDSIHLTPAGVKLKAWIVFQNVVRYLGPLIESGALPAAHLDRRIEHPNFPASDRRLLRIDELASSCSS